MTSLRPSSPLPPPVHPSLRRRNDASNSHLFGSTNPSDTSQPLSPTPRLHRPASSPGIASPTATFAETSSDTDTAKEPRPVVEETLTEAQLRQVYDEEEVDYFLRLFSDHVREVRTIQSQSSSSEGNFLDAASTLELDAESDDENVSWVSPNLEDGQMASSRLSPSHPEQGLAEWIAYRIMPYLPPAAPPRAPPSIRSVRLLIHRVLVIIFHTYLPFFSRAIRLASWEHPKTSLRYCVAYWFLWYHDLLVTSLIVRVAYSLIRRKYLPYPTLNELRQRRQEQERADQLSKTLITRLAASPAEHVKDLWDTFKEYRSSKKKEDIASASPTPISPIPEIVVEGDLAMKDAEIVSEEFVDDHIYSPIFELVTKVADIHERLRNLFLWRRPQVSTMFAFVLLGMFFASFLPVKYTLKLATFGLGFAFWHVVPIIIALPRRMPTPLAFVPTDAEYAMDLISQRIAHGLPVRSTHKHRNSGHNATSNKSSGSHITSENNLRSAASASDQDSKMDWGKWKGRLEDAKNLSGGLAESFKDGTWKDPDSWRQKAKFPPHARANSVQTYTYPAQSKVPGLITLTDSQLFFTPLASSSPTMTIDLKALTGVKRSGLTKGMKVRWITQDNTEHEEKFFWVVERDDLFARLVGSQSGRWLHL